MRIKRKLALLLTAVMIATAIPIMNIQATGDSSSQNDGRSATLNETVVGFTKEATLTDVSLALDGTLKINFKFNGEITDEDGWTINGKAVSTKDMIYTYDVPAKDFNSDIEIKHDDKVIKFSISTMIGEYQKDEKTKDIAASLEAYCAAAKAYFDDDDNTNVDGYSKEVYNSVIGAITPSTETMGEDYYGSSLLLKSETVLRHYYTTPANGRTEKNGLYYVEESVPAHEYSKTDKYCVNDYIYKVLSSNETDANLKNLCVALYNYGKAAKALL